MAVSSPCLTQAHPNSSLGFSSWYKSQDLQYCWYSIWDTLTHFLFRFLIIKTEWPFGMGGGVLCVSVLFFFFGATIHLLSADFICETNEQFCGCWSPRATLDFEIGSDFTQRPSEKRTSVYPCSEQRDCGFSLLLQGREPWTGSFPSRTWNSSLLPASLESLFCDFSIFFLKKTEGSSGCVWNMVCLFPLIWPTAAAFLLNGLTN